MRRNKVKGNELNQKCGNSICDKTRDSLTKHHLNSENVTRLCVHDEVEGVSGTRRGDLREKKIMKLEIELSENDDV